MADSASLRTRRYLARKRGETLPPPTRFETGTGWPSERTVKRADRRWRRFKREHGLREAPLRVPSSGTRRGVCSECGGPMHVGPDSLPPDRRRCQKCSRANPRRSRPDPRPCLVCEKIFQPKAAGNNRGHKWTKACSRSCGGKLAAWERLRPGESFDRDALALVSERRRMRRTVRSRERHLRHAQTWDGITDEEIWERDGWRCRVPECLYRSRKINPQYKYPDPRSRGIDHIVPLSHGGDDTSVNKRAAHHGCNMARGNRMGDEQLPLIGSLREPPLATGLAGVAAAQTIRERRPPKPPKPKVLRMRQCPCGQRFARLGGKGKRCPDCLADVAKRALAMREQGYRWQEIAAELGRASGGSLWTLAQKYGGDERGADWSRDAGGAA